MMVSGGGQAPRNVRGKERHRRHRRGNFCGSKKTPPRLHCHELCVPYHMR